MNGSAIFKETTAGSALHPHSGFRGGNGAHDAGRLRKFDSSSAELNGATRAPLVSPLLPLQTQRRFRRNRAGAPPTRLLMWYPGLASKIACENSPADYDAGESARLGI
jgi:hypothetical protein